MADDDALLEILALNLVNGVGPRMLTLLLERFETAGRVLRASGAELLDVPGVGPKLSAEITRALQSDRAVNELKRCQAAGIKLLIRGSDQFPPMLEETCDPPNVLYCQGEYREGDQLAIGVVGSRSCTMYGRQQAERLSGALARAGITIISGLARGIDAAAHRGALAAGGRTIAVCATGLENIYPPEHQRLSEEICEAGALLTESPLDRAPSAGLFPQRNRIISGLSLGVLVIEANRKSGAMHTVRHAMEQGREVFAVPGRIDCPASQGCHDLIRDGVPLVRDVDDILEALGPLLNPVRRNESVGAPLTETVLTPRELTLNDQERLVLNIVTLEPILIDEVLRQLELEPSRVLSTLTILEMKRFVRRLPGGLVSRISH
ncbi:MAG: DNA-processing protein DprA [Planctomycetaceae bacterium]